MSAFQAEDGSSILPTRTVKADASYSDQHIILMALLFHPTQNSFIFQHLLLILPQIRQPSFSICMYSHDSKVRDTILRFLSSLLLS